MSEIKQIKNNTRGSRISLHIPQLNNDQLIKLSGYTCILKIKIKVLSIL